MRNHSWCFEGKKLFLAGKRAWPPRLRQMVCGLNIGYCTFASQVVRFARICNNIDGISVRILFLYDLFIKLGFDSGKLIRNFRNCISHHKFDKKFNNIGQILPTISN